MIILKVTEGTWESDKNLLHCTKLKKQQSCCHTQHASAEQVAKDLSRFIVRAMIRPKETCDTAIYGCNFHTAKWPAKNRKGPQLLKPST